MAGHVHLLLECVFKNNLCTEFFFSINVHMEYMVLTTLHYVCCNSEHTFVYCYLVIIFVVHGMSGLKLIIMPSDYCFQ